MLAQALGCLLNQYAITSLSYALVVGKLERERGNTTMNKGNTMEFAFYRTSGCLHDIQDCIDGEAINPATGELYSEEHIADLIRLNDYEFDEDGVLA